MHRPPILSRFYDCARQALQAQAYDNPSALAATARIFSAIELNEGTYASAQPGTIPACCHLDDVMGELAGAKETIGALARALLQLSPSLVWVRRDDASRVGEPFLSGHANTWIAGQGAFEERSDVIIGASLLAPGVVYPEHQHAPEEMYIVMSEGEWYNEDDGWYTPGIGSIVYHRPWIRHAMRSGTTTPLLAVWCLCVETNNAGIGSKVI